MCLHLAYTCSEAGKSVLTRVLKSVYMSLEIGREEIEKKKKRKRSLCKLTVFQLVTQMCKGVSKKGEK